MNDMIRWLQLLENADAQGIRQLALAEGMSEADADRFARVVDTWRREADTDSLTGLLNRRGIARAVGRISPPSGAEVIWLDVADFKAWNDTYGHAAGDARLVALADVLQAAVSTGWVVRWGGDEFVVLLPEGGAEAWLKEIDWPAPVHAAWLPWKGEDIATISGQLSLAAKARLFGH